MDLLWNIINYRVILFLKSLSVQDDENEQNIFIETSFQSIEEHYGNHNLVEVICLFSKAIKCKNHTIRETKTSTHLYRNMQSKKIFTAKYKRSKVTIKNDKHSGT